ncbi:4'-phosphopantetheinyl transferase superfamily protein [Basilea psittacipulmonis]|uniref:4'-phosphopantetheinyl transferase superfamily protein n=1 Tax=Basilea psittacipulmonis TaxID=1472345 RepID=UPI000691700D|nr:4'-phosphopantetheinyl transferase superfamily protein [Basilea psittacipulmonis]
MDNDPITRVILTTWQDIHVPKCYQADHWKSEQATPKDIQTLYLLHQIFRYFQLPESLLNNIQIQDNGRPFIPNSPIDFNISHSGPYLAIAVTSYQAVGVDIESKNKNRSWSALLPHILNTREQAYLQPSTTIRSSTRSTQQALSHKKGVGMTIEKQAYSKCPPTSPSTFSTQQELKHEEWLAVTMDHAEKEAANKEQSLFLSHWCIKESILKSQGKGIDELKQISVFLQQQQFQSTFPCPPACYLIENDQFVLSIASHTEPQIFTYHGDDQWEKCSFSMIKLHSF